MGFIWITMFAALQAPAQACPAKTVPANMLIEVIERGIEEPVRGLEVGDLSLVGKGAEPTPIGLATGFAADIVVLIEDRSRGGLLAGAGDLLVKSLKPGDQVAVMTYGVSSKRQLAFSKDPDAIRAAIEKGADSLQLQLARPLYGVVDAMKLFNKPEPGRLRAIFLLGDNIDYASHIRVEQLASNLIEDRITVDLAMDPAPRRIIPRVNVPPPTVGNESPAMRPALVGQQSVAQLAEATGGTALAYVRAEFFKAMRERLAQRFSVQYCVEKKQLSRPPAVELSAAGKRKFPNAEVRSPGLPGR
jgi:hypothetical protein